MNLHSKIVLGFVWFAILFTFFSCKKKDNPVSPTGRIVESSNYSVVGNKVIMIAEPSIYVYCSGNILIHDTSNDVHPDTLEYFLLGNRLEMSNRRLDTLLSGSIVYPEIMVLTRLNSGEGLNGLWIISDYEYKIISGVPSAAEIDNLNHNLLNEKQELLEDTFEIEFATNSIHVYESNRDFASYFIRMWKTGGYNHMYLSDSAFYNISFQKIDRLSINLTGNVTKEIVAIEWNDNGDETYSSNNSANLVHTHYAKPIACPNLSEPAWYSSFLLLNKRAGVSEKMANDLSNHPKNRNKSFSELFAINKSFLIIESK